ncbi:MAG: lamin tail domain-containing protein [Paludibacteraceae bacterium]|nr:lamin tail domain-containing protein [Paludibacteraceae bacterium]
MQSNIDNLMENKDFPDSWVELYNPTDADVDLYGYCIGQDADLSQGTQWLISQNHNLVIPAGGYLLIYCDKEATGVHTDFRLESGKGNIPSGVYFIHIITGTGNSYVEKFIVK